MSILDHHLISERYFFPRPQPPHDPFYVDVNGGRLACHFHRPHPGGKTVIHFHGNGEVVADYQRGYLPPFSSWGFNLLLAEYRGYGGSSGEPALAGMLDDVDRIIKASGQPASELVLFGRSLGSIYAIHGAHLYPDIAGLIIESGISNTYERLRLRVHPEELGCDEAGLATAVKQNLDHQTKLAGYHNPLLILHTRHDGLLDLYHAEENHQWAASEKKQLKIFEQGTHNDIFGVNMHAYNETVGQFLQNL